MFVERAFGTRLSYGVLKQEKYLKFLKGFKQENI
jgi:hypothetical protein